VDSRRSSHRKVSLDLLNSLLEEEIGNSGPWAEPFQSLLEERSEETEDPDPSARPFQFPVEKEIGNSGPWAEPFQSPLPPPADFDKGLPLRPGLVELLSPPPGLEMGLEVGALAPPSPSATAAASPAASPAALTSPASPTPASSSPSAT